MTHTPNSDASEREREILIMAADDGVCSSVLSKRTANMLRADAETIRSLEAELFTRGELLTQKNEQLAARSAEVEALRKVLSKVRTHAAYLPMCTGCEIIELIDDHLQEKSNAAG